MAKDKKQPERLSGFDQLMVDFDGKHSKKMNAILLEQAENDVDAFAVNYFKLAEYVKPKLQRTEMEVEDTTIDVRLHHVRSKADDA